ncbi:hypothetical protein [Polyangium sp. 6x1]|uniref:hypothetical protein n=1 Tax=Polyangium sp. 6x1 TaxID=3042689 RepID=UPI00248234D9|nr:hypothetical protein [Polyangium sp. 6x1]MDI1442786.1 hypothetical protein [Polyangium sp. 6x1]
MSSSSRRRRREAARRAPTKAGTDGWPRDFRHAYVQLVEGDALVERDLRAEADVAAQGRVLEATYLEKRGLFERMFGVFSGEPASAARKLAPPFDGDGGDAPGLFAGSSDVLPLEPRGAALGQVRRVRGRVVPLGPDVPPDGAVLRAIWLDKPPALHACEAIEFAVIPDEGPPVVLSFDLSPLVVDRPSRVSVSGFLSRVGPRMRALLREMEVDRSRREEGQFVQISSGQTVEVLCVIRAEVRDTHAFSIHGVSRTLPMEARPQDGGPYRGTSTRNAVLAGDAPGTRAVVRRIG